MTKTNVQLTPSNSQHHDTPNNKTHIIKFRVTAEEKAPDGPTCCSTASRPLRRKSSGACCARVDG